MSNDIVLLHTAQGEVEAQLLRELLENQGIPCHITGESLRLTHMFTVDGLGAVKVWVAASMEAEAREVLRTLQSGELAIDETWSPEGEEALSREKMKSMP